MNAEHDRYKWAYSKDVKRTNVSEVSQKPTCKINTIKRIEKYNAAFSRTSSTMDWNSFAAYSCLATASIVDVLPVPGGP